jgi:hypothetical protein
MDLVLPPGEYDLWLWLRPAEADQASTRLVYSKAFRSEFDAGYTRTMEPAGEGTWESRGSVAPLVPATSSPLPFLFVRADPASGCSAYWALYLGDAVVGQGSAGDCG